MIDSVMDTDQVGSENMETEQNGSCWDPFIEVHLLNFYYVDIWSVT